jgi:hypothetical protein
VSKTERLSCLIVRSGQYAAVVNVDIAAPEQVDWLDPSIRVRESGTWIAWVRRMATVNGLAVADFFVFDLIGALCHSRRLLRAK